MDANLQTGAERIVAERARQISQERWTQAHDAEHEAGELAWAAASYTVWALINELPSRLKAAINIVGLDPLALWPWGIEWFKTEGGYIRILEKAGALIAAEIDRVLAEASK